MTSAVEITGLGQPEEWHPTAERGPIESMPRERLTHAVLATTCIVAMTGWIAALMHGGYQLAQWVSQ